ncbi:Hepatocyte growth factor-regulated tyrosine kinase substrate [Collichthys lucidus]|uniref:Hepatocyte growth factor-regulated tyrosine kinase substrate n=1 Tax=Collichthys lucidus TaxID=240159 RepID=A0A4U5VVK1_COLLU|nr:Hepatocyte growth factor-regulated tyrosine kinase substrate [Collichthys lucidus]
MATTGMQLLGLIMSIVGWVSGAIVCAIPLWRVTAFIGNNIVTAQIIWEGLWMTCIVQSTGQIQCKVYDSLLALPSDMQAARGLTVFSILICGLALALGVLGVKCTKCIGVNSVKARIARISGALFAIAGFLYLVPVCWTAHSIIRDFYDPHVAAPHKRELGPALYIGWGASALLLIGGSLLYAGSSPPGIPGSPTFSSGESSPRRAPASQVKDTLETNMGKGGGTFERLLDKATSQLLLETDWESILQICDLIRQGDAQAKYAIGAIKKKLNDKNPHVALYALEVLESVVKNCGQTVHDEVASKQTMEELKDLLKKQTEPNVRNKILYLIQAWAHAFRNEPKYKVVQDTYQIMKVEGHVFPEFKESDAMFAAERAPDWVDAEECHRCRVQFGVMTRKHHCRACGQIFCGKCSSKYSTIPKFGIEKEVRVCEPCFELLNKKAEGKAPAAGPAELPPEYLTSPLSQQSQMPPKRDEAALQEEEELQLAIALSQSEAEEKERMNSSAPSAEDVDPELARYLNRTYWEKKQEEARKSPTPSAPAPVPLAEPLPPISQPVETHVPVQPVSIVEQQYQNGESEENHEQFLKALQNAVTTFLNRMKSNHMRGRSITNDSAVLSLFQSINNMHPQLLDILNQLDEKRLYYEGLQDKLAQVRDARAALNALRDEHREKLRRAAEEAERQRQIQLAQKLEIMRQKETGVPGDAKTAGHPAPSGAGEGEADASGAAEAHNPDESPNACLLSALCSGTHCIHKLTSKAIQRKFIYFDTTNIFISIPFLFGSKVLMMSVHAVMQMQSLPPNVAGGVVYQPGAPPSYPGTFSPAGSVEGSPMHNIYMNQPGQTAPPQYQAMPSAATDPNMVNAYMYQAAGTNGQPAPPPGQAPPNTSPPYSNYQPTPTQGYQNVVSQAQSMPPMSQAAPTNGMGYMGYQPYSMQNMISALPGQDPNMPPQQPYMQGQQPMYQQVAPPGGPPQQQQQQQQQVPQPVPGSAEAQLISFD